MKLEVGSTIYSGFVEAHIRASMDTIFDSFIFIAANRWGDDKPILLGDDCRVLDPDGVKMLDGFITSIKAPIGGDLTISGSDRTFDLVGCTAGGTGEFRALSVKQIIERIVSPFGISVTGKAGATINVFRYGLNEKALDVIRDLCARHGLLANSDGNGNINLTTATTTARATLQLVESNNILSASVQLGEGRFSDVAMLGQNRTGSVLATATGTASRHRPLTIIESGNLTAGQATTGAAWAASLDKPEQYFVSVAGINDVRPNTLIDIEAETLGVSGTLLVRAVTWSMDRAGLTTALELVNPAAFGGANQLNDWVK